MQEICLPRGNLRRRRNQPTPESVAVETNGEKININFENISVYNNRNSIIYN